MYMGPGGGDACSFFQEKDNFAFSFKGSGSQSQNGGSSFGQGRSAYNPHLATHSGKWHGSIGISAYLSRQVDFNGRMDGCGFWVLSNGCGVVFTCRIPKEYRRIVVYKVHPFFASHGKGGHHFPREDLFVLSCYGSKLKKRQQTLGKQLRVDALLAVVHPLRLYGIG